MTIREMLASTRSGLKAVGQLRYKTATTSGAGAAGGTTLVSTGLAGVDDAWNEMEVKITSGTNSGERRNVGDWVNSTSTMTFVNPFTTQVATTVTFEVGEKGFFSDHELLDMFTESQLELRLLLRPEAFPADLEWIAIAGTAGSATVPATVHESPQSMLFVDTAASGEYDVTILPVDEKDRFRDDAFLGSQLKDIVAIFEEGKIKYRPTDAGSFKIPQVPIFANVTFTTGSVFPAYLHSLQITYAVWRGWLKREHSDIAQVWRQSYLDSIATINERVKGTIKQMTSLTKGRD